MRHFLLTALVGCVFCGAFHSGGAQLCHRQTWQEKAISIFSLPAYFYIKTYLHTHSFCLSSHLETFPIHSFTHSFLLRLKPLTTLYIFSWLERDASVYENQNSNHTLLVSHSCCNIFLHTILYQHVQLNARRNRDFHPSAPRSWG